MKNDFKAQMLKKYRSKKPGANAATKSILDYLNMAGFVAWRNNTTGIFDVKSAASKLISLSKQCVNHRRMPTAKEIESVLFSSFRKNAGRNGISDVLGFEKRTGKIIAVEVKTGKDSLKPEQKRFLNDVRKNGGIAIVASCAGDVVDELEKQKQNA